MFGKRIELLRLLGCSVRIDPGWLLLTVLITWSLAVDVFPVVDGDRLVGCVTTRSIDSLAHEQWNEHTVGSITTPCSDDNTVRPDGDASRPWRP